MFSDEFAHIAQECQYIALTRFSEQFAVVLSDIDSQEVKTIINMSDMRFLFREC